MRPGVRARHRGTLINDDGLQSYRNRQRGDAHASAVVMAATSHDEYAKQSGALAISLLVTRSIRAEWQRRDSRISPSGSVGCQHGAIVSRCIKCIGREHPRASLTKCLHVGLAGYDEQRARHAFVAGLCLCIGAFEGP